MLPRDLAMPGLLIWLLLSSASAQGVVWPVDTNAAGLLGNGIANGPELSNTGRFLTFQSTANNLVAGDTNGTFDLFLKDMVTGSVERISVTSMGTQTSTACYTSGLVSESGRHVIFNCLANDLVPGDTNGIHDIFLRDRQLGTTTRINLGLGGQEANGLSIVVGISSDGRFIVYVSDATNLVFGDSNGFRDVFVYDSLTGITTIESNAPNGLPANERCDSSAISADGRMVVFTSRASNLVPNDTNGFSDIFIRDRVLGTTTRVNETMAGTAGNNHSISPSCSISGNLVTFLSLATNYAATGGISAYNVFVKDLGTGTLSLVNQTSTGMVANNGSLWTRISGGGRYVIFTSIADNLSPLDSPLTNDLYVRDLLLGTTRRLTYDSAGDPVQIPCIPFLPSQPCGGQYLGAAIAADATLVVFDHADFRLIPGATGGQQSHIFATYLDCSLRAALPAVLGAPLMLSLEASTGLLAPYLLALSLNFEPGIPFLSRLLPLNPDPLFELALAPFPLFQGFAGTLDASGLATATILLPAAPSLFGLTFYAAFVTGDVNAPLGIHRVSNAVRITI